MRFHDLRHACASLLLVQGVHSYIQSEARQDIAFHLHVGPEALTRSAHHRVPLSVSLSPAGGRVSLRQVGPQNVTSFAHGCERRIDLLVKRLGGQLDVGRI